MYNVVFHYEDPKLDTLCNNITSIGQIEAQWMVFEDDELMNHHYNLHKDFYLHSSDTSYVISAKGLIGVEIRKI